MHFSLPLSFPLMVLFVSSLFFACNGKPPATRGEEALAKGDFAAATKFFRRAAAKNPSSIPIFYNLGCAASRAGQVQEACNAFREVLRFVPGDFDATECLAAELRKTRNHKDLVESHELLSSLLPLEMPPSTRARILSSLSLTDSALHRHDVALGHLLLAIHADPFYAPTQFNFAKLCNDAFQLPSQALNAMSAFCAMPSADQSMIPAASQFIASVRPIASAITPPPQDQTSESVTLYNKGRNEYDRRNYQAAATAFEKAVAISPNFYAATLSLANVYYSMNRLPEASATYGKAAKIAPDNFEPIYWQGFLAYNSNHLDDAVKIFSSTAIPKWPDEPRSYELLAYAYTQQQRYYEAKLFGELFLLVSKKTSGKTPAAFQSWVNTLPNVPFKP